jgi:hypothetical protein
MLRQIQQRRIELRALKKESRTNPNSGSADIVVPIAFDRKKFENLFKLLGQEEDINKRPFVVGDISENNIFVDALLLHITCGHRDGGRKW